MLYSVYWREKTSQSLCRNISRGCQKATKKCIFGETVIKILTIRPVLECLKHNDCNRFFDQNRQQKYYYTVYWFLEVLEIAAYCTLLTCILRKNIICHYFQMSKTQHGGKHVGLSQTRMITPFSADSCCKPLPKHLFSYMTAEIFYFGIGFVSTECID